AFRTEFGRCAPAAGPEQRWKTGRVLVTDKIARVTTRLQRPAPRFPWQASCIARPSAAFSATPSRTPMPVVSMRQLLDHAAENGYGIPAFNVNNLEQVQA